jgi:hypothetical protein
MIPRSSTCALGHDGIFRKGEEWQAWFFLAKN